MVCILDFVRVLKQKRFLLSVTAAGAGKNGQSNAFKNHQHIIPDEFSFISFW